MEKLLKVSKTAQGKKYTNKIHISGEWLKKYGFNFGDMVRVEIKRNKIVIYKDDKTELLTAMCEGNPNIEHLVERLEMSL